MLCSKLYCINLQKFRTFFYKILRAELRHRPVQSFGFRVWGYGLGFAFCVHSWGVVCGVNGLGLRVEG